MADARNFAFPLEWEKVPVTGTDLGVDTYRYYADGAKGWIISVVDRESKYVVSTFYVPDENMAWGK